jgi:hypothetical protein
MRVTNWLTNHMEQSYCPGVERPSFNQEIASILRGQDVHYRVHKKLATYLCPEQGQHSLFHLMFVVPYILVIYMFNP